MSTSLVMSYSLPPIRSTSSPSGSSDLRTFERLLKNIYQGRRILLRDVERLRGHFHRIYILDSLGGYSFILKCPPPRLARTLRHQTKALETEGRVLDLIRATTQLPVPQRIGSDATGDNAIRSPFLLRSYLTGRPLSSIESHLSVTERESIDRTLGSYIRSISSIRANTFGSVHRVYSGSGHSTWREAYLSLVESVLRDCEDILVSLPYDSIRYYTSAQSHVLDAVTDPHLVPLEAGIPSNVLIDEQSRQICGLLGFSHVIWGDPQLAWCFIDPSTAFLEGYGVQAACDRGERTRQLLYTVYRSLVTIATRNTRSQEGDDELNARRILNWALNQLA